ncbi:microtubule-associated protein 9 isoform X2 [Myxocyprinus asiaticus]|uniref:microtubule-associated protein 9 isoform X2 n=1 Tax=Myxocyprinus asiaticus TaxID=70543 RepID=UPI002223AE16|nr:microtubule-associated protein 9 isoform X2 [Myxocyprinus asiaticus]
MMDDKPFSTTLAHTKSPKTSRRTTFQDELEAAVSTRASRHKQSYSDDFDDDDDDDDDDDVFNKLLKIQKQKKARFKSGRTKGKINDFKLSDDEEENVNPKKVVSFLKTKRKSSTVQDEQLNSLGSIDSHGSFRSTQSMNTPQSPSNSQTPVKHQQSDSPLSFQSDKCQPESTLLQNADHSESVMRMRRTQAESSEVKKSPSDSHLPLNSENSQWESPDPLLTEDPRWDSPLPLPSEKDGELPIPQPRERSVKPTLSTGFLSEDNSPRPKPRQKTLNMWDSCQLEEETQAETPACSRAATSSMSIALSNMSSSEKSQTPTKSVQGTDKGRVMSERIKTQSSLTEEQVSEAPATAGSAASEESKEGQHSTSFQENHECPHANSYHTSTTQSQISSKSTDRPPGSWSSSSRKSKSSYRAESKYLGTLKILDQRIQETQQTPAAADSLRAAVYQEWLRKKEENIEIAMRAKKQEEKLKEEKRQEEKLAKIADAKASYNAWKEKKAEAIRKKRKEKQEAINMQQMEMDKNQEKKDTAKQVFEKWKQEHDSILKERIRKMKQTEKRQILQQVREKEERKRDCTSAFNEWSGRKKDVIQEKVKAEHKEKIKEVEEKYEKEEREKIALEMYDKWMKRKEFQQKRERKEKKIQEILQDVPPPPWSPPNKTIPFGK